MTIRERLRTILGTKLLEIRKLMESVVRYSVRNVGIILISASLAVILVTADVMALAINLRTPGNLVAVPTALLTVEGFLLRLLPKSRKGLVLLNVLALNWSVVTVMFTAFAVSIWSPVATSIVFLVDVALFISVVNLYVTHIMAGRDQSDGDIGAKWGLGTANANIRTFTGTYSVHS